MKRMSWLASAFWLVSALMLIALSGCTESEAIENKEEVARPVPIEVVSIADQTSSLRFPGRVRSATRADLTFNVPGRVVKLLAEEGQLVEKGALVAELDNSNYQIQMNSALAKYNKARTDYQRVKQLWEKSRAVAKTEVDKQRTAMDVAEADYALAKKDFDDTRLVAPFKGVVTKRHVENFSNVQSKQSIINLQDLTNLEIVINVPERLVRNAPKELTAHAVFADQPTQLLPVSLKSFSSVSDSQTQTYEVVVTLESGYKLNVLPGMSVDILPQKSAEGLHDGQAKVPLQAISASANGTSGVWIFNPETSRVTWQKVVLGDVQGSDVLVVNGLNGGEQIVTAGVSQLRETLLVRIYKQ